MESFAQLSQTDCTVCDHRGPFSHSCTPTACGSIAILCLILTTQEFDGGAEGVATNDFFTLAILHCLVYIIINRYHVSTAVLKMSKCYHLL